MNTLSRVTAFAACALLLSVPVAAGCLGPGMMADDCPMIGGQEKVPAVSMPCHESAPVADPPVSDDCCETEPAPEPIQALSFDTAKLVIALDVAELPVAATFAPPLQLIVRTSADSVAEQCVRRYELFSSLLL